MTFFAELLAKESDFFGYSTYVFKNLDADNPLDKYVMCTRCKNWIHKSIEIHDKGFVTVKPVVAGVDTWYNGEEQIPYKYTNVYFEKFVSLNDKKEDIVL